uniref:Uncharacterized protein n=1 Tax=Myotis myotis TaxID=51298 RepID=A0A7J7SR86_MYOMY|nr:hypothetical protein mMyoMyo1_009334 [Myotis myotis]
MKVRKNRNILISFPRQRQESLNQLHTPSCSSSSSSPPPATGARASHKRKVCVICDLLLDLSGAQPERRLLQPCSSFRSSIPSLDGQSEPCSVCSEMMGEASAEAKTCLRNTAGSHVPLSSLPDTQEAVMSWRKGHFLLPLKKEPLLRDQQPALPREASGAQRLLLSPHEASGNLPLGSLQNVNPKGWCHLG